MRRVMKKFTTPAVSVPDKGPQAVHAAPANSLSLRSKMLPLRRPMLTRLATSLVTAGVENLQLADPTYDVVGLFVMHGAPSHVTILGPMPARPCAIPAGSLYFPMLQRVSEAATAHSAFLTKEPKLLLNDDNAGKPEGIHLMIGRGPTQRFGNSDGDREMLEYTGAGAGAQLMMLVLHNDAQREYAYGPAQGLPETKVGTFSQALYEEAKKNWK
jgi:hypothetical protein